MSETSRKLKIGFIPLVDAAALIVASDMGLAREEGLEIELVREVSWSNVRDKLNIGLFDAAHLLAPVAIASTLGLGHVQVPLVAPFCLGLNGNAITVSPALFAEMRRYADGDLSLPKVSARALADVVCARQREGAAPLTFGMTFPFSTHNYQLRFWMAEGGIDPDEDVRLVVLPPPYMVESLASGHVDGFCVGAPWNSVAVEQGVGHILHFGTDVVSIAAEKVLAVRQDWADTHGDTLARLVRALARSAAIVADPARHAEIAALLARPERIHARAEEIRAALSGRLKIDADGQARADNAYLIAGGRLGEAQLDANRPDPLLATWLYTQMTRWRQVAFEPAQLAQAQGVFRADLYDAALGVHAPGAGLARVQAFAGPTFEAANFDKCLAYWASL